MQRENSVISEKERFLEVEFYVLRDDIDYPSTNC